MPIAIVTDSSSDLGPAKAAEAGIELVPCLVYFGDEVQRDGTDIGVDVFYDRLAKSTEIPKTTAPPAHAFTETFARLTAAGKEVVCVTVSSALSKTYVNASEAAAAFPGKVHVVDGKSVSAGTALLATGAAKLAKNGTTASQVVATLEKWIASEQGHLMYKDFKFLEKGGRIDQKQLVLATTMHLVPLMRVNAKGALESEATAKTWDEARDLLLSITGRKIERPASTHVAITHANAPELARFASDALDAKCAHGLAELNVYPAGPTIGTNFGPGFLGIFMRED